MADRLLFFQGKMRDSTSKDWHAVAVGKAHAAFSALDLPTEGLLVEPRAGTAVRWAMGDPRVSSVLVGLADLEQLDVALNASAKGALPADSAAKLEPLFQTLFGKKTAAKL